MFKKPFILTLLIAIGFYIAYTLLYVVLTALSFKDGFSALNSIVVKDLLTTVGVLLLAIIYAKRTNRKPNLLDKDWKGNMFYFVILLISLSVLKLFVLDIAIDDVSVLRDSQSNTGAKFLDSLSFYFLSPINEEFIFRGLVLCILLQVSAKPLLIIVYSSLLFVIIHLNASNYADMSYLMIIFILGMFLAVIYIKFGLVASIIAHILFNIIKYRSVALFLGIEDKIFKDGYILLPIVSIILTLYAVRSLFIPPHLSVCDREE